MSVCVFFADRTRLVRHSTANTGKHLQEETISKPDRQKEVSRRPDESLSLACVPLCFHVRYCDVHFYSALHEQRVFLNICGKMCVLSFQVYVVSKPLDF